LARDIAWQLARSLDVPGSDATGCNTKVQAGDVRLDQDTLSTEHSNSKFDPPINRRSFSGARAQHHSIYLHSSDLRSLAATSSKAQTRREQGQITRIRRSVSKAVVSDTVAIGRMGMSSLTMNFISRGLLGPDRPAAQHRRI